MTNKDALIDQIDQIVGMVECAHDDITRSSCEINEINNVFQTYFERHPEEEANEKQALYSYLEGFIEEFSGIVEGLEAVLDVFSDLDRTLSETDDAALDDLFEEE